MNKEIFYHEPVLLHECIEGLSIKPNGTYLDATFGGGGHSRAILSHLNTDGKLIVFDQDADARQNVPDDDRILFVPENFRYAARFVRLYRIGKIDGVLADLGVSSHQFDTAHRGFSTRFDAQLDMRMDARQVKTAAHILKEYSEQDLKNMFEQYGEITNAKILAKQLVQVRQATQIQTIQQFKQAIENCVYGNPNKYWAQVFQALRIELNEELIVLQEFLETITPCLAPQARLCVITFHSLEDRIVKQWIKNPNKEIPHVLQKIKTQEHTFKTITKKPITATDNELKSNPRSRSAKLRVAEYI
ncbi:MAG: 16S rRNA (cytosine(1402)-N(4))-methyltransferase RsmH [Chitinophagaceae bacterium]